MADLFDPDLTAHEKRLLKFVNEATPVRVRNGYFFRDRKISLKSAQKLKRMGMAQDVLIHHQPRLTTTPRGRALLDSTSKPSR